MRPGSYVYIVLERNGPYKELHQGKSYALRSTEKRRAEFIRGLLIGGT